MRVLVASDLYELMTSVSYLLCTGDGCSVTLYTENDYGGDSLTIDENSQIWLEQVRINGGSEDWNDNVMSIYFQSHSGAVVNDQSSGIYPGHIPPTADHCVSLFGSDPFGKVGPHGTSNVVLCGDPFTAKTWKFTYDDISDMLHGKTLKMLSLGPSFIAIGSCVQLQAFSGPNFDGNTLNMKSKGTGVSIDLTKLKYPSGIRSNPYGKVTV